MMMPTGTCDVAFRLNSLTTCKISDCQFYLWNRVFNFSTQADHNTKRKPNWTGLLMEGSLLPLHWLYDATTTNNSTFLHC